MNPCPSPETLRGFLDGAPDDDVAAHVRDCPTCQAVLDGLCDTGAMRSWMASPPRPARSAGPALARALDALRQGRPAEADTRRPMIDTVEAAARSTAAGQLAAIGPYLIEAELGRGGMAVVYRARHAGLNRVVALKMIRAGEITSSSALERFRNEAEAVVALDHPHIVPLYEVGEHQGQPYFSMKLIEGGTLTQALHDRTLGPREAVGVVARVARAVHYAHQRGILHRDLKPSNILLEVRAGEVNAPTPFVTDFGLAKRADADSALTQSGVVLGTPSYMAPEQAAGKPGAVTTLADVYGLGAILYEVLTGRPPFRGDGLLETMRQVQEREPEPPAKVNPAADRDVATVCLKCLSKDPRRRYASAAELADDLERFLAGEPIHARPVGTWERTLKWARRHPAVAVLGTLCVLGVVALAVSAIALGRLLVVVSSKNEELATANHKARAAADRAQQTIEDMTSPAALKFLGTQPQLRPEQRQFLTQAVAYYREFTADRPADRDGRMRRAVAYTRMGQLQRDLGLQSDAEAAYRGAVQEYERLAADYPDAPEFRHGLAVGHDDLGVLLDSLGKREDAESEYRSAIDHSDHALAVQPDVPEYRERAASAHIHLANLFFSVGRLKDAQPEYDVVIVQLTRLVAERPGNPAYRRQLALAQYSLGDLRATLGQRREAETAFLAAIRLQTELAWELPGEPVYRQELAISHNNFADMLVNAGQWPRAEGELRLALKEQERLVAENPQMAEYRQDLANTQYLLGSCLAALGKRPEAAVAFRSAIQTQERLTAEQPKVPAYADDLGVSYAGFGHFLRDGGAPDQALDWYAKAIATLEGVLRQMSTDTKAREGLRDSHVGRATALAKLKRFADAWAAWDRGLSYAEPTQREALRLQRAVLFARAGQYDRATAEADDLVRSGQPTAAMLYDAACVFGLSAAQAADTSRRDGYAARAVELLHLAVAKGFHDGGQIDKDKDLDALRARADFQELLIKVRRTK